MATTSGDAAIPSAAALLETAAWFVRPEEAEPGPLPEGCLENMKAFAQRSKFAKVALPSNGVASFVLFHSCEKFLQFTFGATVCKSCRSRKTLKNKYLDAKIGVDTAENEPSKV